MSLVAPTGWSAFGHTCTHWRSVPSAPHVAVGGGTVVHVAGAVPPSSHAVPGTGLPLARKAGRSLNVSPPFVEYAHEMLSRPLRSSNCTVGCVLGEIGWLSWISASPPPREQSGRSTAAAGFGQASVVDEP